MAPPNVALLADRGVVRVAGADAEKLLQGIITSDIGLLASQQALHAALLTPQGKILFEFFVARDEGQSQFFLDVAQDGAAALIKRLTLYKLRAKVEFEDLSHSVRVVAVWGGALHGAASQEHENLAHSGSEFSTREFPDPRHHDLGWRWLVRADRAEELLSTQRELTRRTQAEYDAHRIALGVPEGGKDYALGDTFPHEADLDQLHGVSFSKGCFIGQEVVSRMQHRANVRKRVVPIIGDAPLTSGVEVMVGSVAIGAVGSVAGNDALALIRLDRAAEAKAKGEALTAGGIRIALRKPDWATFELAPAVAARTP